MSSGPNHRRGHGRIQDSGTRPSRKLAREMDRAFARAGRDIARTPRWFRPLVRRTPQGAVLEPLVEAASRSQAASKRRQLLRRQLPGARLNVVGFEVVEWFEDADGGLLRQG